MAVQDRSRLSASRAPHPIPIIDRETPFPRKRSRAWVNLFLALIVASSLGLLGFFQWQEPIGSNSGPPGLAETAYLPHSPIFIYGDVGFLAPNSSTGVVWGGGTESDPYIIQGWSIISVGDIGILIQGATVHFVIQSCYVHDLGPMGTGIYLADVANGSVVDNSCQGNLIGIFIASSENTTLSHNDCSNNGVCIDMVSSKNNRIENNNCSQNGGAGISLTSSSENILAGNDCSRSGSIGIHFTSSSENTLIDNNCSDIAGEGMYLDRSGGNEITLNNCSDNSNYGVMVIDSTSANNTIWNNTFLNNKGAGATYDVLHAQAYDEGTDNRWNSTEGYGNYWSDWTAPDDNSDGIVDYPYALGGTAGALDHYPRAEPVEFPIPEFSAGVICVLAMLALTTMGICRKSFHPKHKK